MGSLIPNGVWQRQMYWYKQGGRHPVLILESFIGSTIEDYSAAQNKYKATVCEYDVFDNETKRHQYYDPIEWSDDAGRSYDSVLQKLKVHKKYPVYLLYRSEV